MDSRASNIGRLEHADKADKDTVEWEAKEERASTLRDWTDEEERKVKRKLDTCLMTLLALGLFALQLDKGNISNALTSTITEDLGISTNTVNAGSQVTLASIVAFEIPFNMILSRVGPQRWLTFEAFAWGMVALFQGWIKNKADFFVTRFLLGMFEAGYLPGSMTVMSTFYTRSEMAMRMTVLYIGNYCAAGVSSLIAAGVFELDGVRGLAGWRWLFIIDGSVTILVVFVFIFFLPESTTQTLPLCRIRAFDFFTDRDRHIMSKRIELENIEENVTLSSISVREAWKILTTNPYLWGHFLINLITLVPKGGLALYSPTIIKSLGFDTIKANALSSVSNWGVIILALGAAWVSDSTRLRGLVCLVCSAYSLVFAGAQYHMTGSSSSKWPRYVVYMLLNSGNAIGQGINDAWLASNIRDPKARCLGLALCVMGSNTAGIIGQQLFRSEGAPKYTSSFVAIMGMYAGSIVLIALQMGQYAIGNRKLRRLAMTVETPEDVDGINLKKYDI